MKKNPSSGRVMQKRGMKQEGQFEKQCLRFNEFQDMEAYGLLKKDFQSN